MLGFVSYQVGSSVRVGQIASTNSLLLQQHCTVFCGAFTKNSFKTLKLSVFVQSFQISGLLKLAYERHAGKRDHIGCCDAVPRRPQFIVESRDRLIVVPGCQKQKKPLFSFCSVFLSSWFVQIYRASYANPDGTPTTGPHLQGFFIQTQFGALLRLLCFGKVAPLC